MLLRNVSVRNGIWSVPTHFTRALRHVVDSSDKNKHIPSEGAGRFWFSAVSHGAGCVGSRDSAYIATVT